MAYSTANPPKTLISGIGGGGPSLWLYSSADIHTDVDAAGYFTNGHDLGMRVGDIVMVHRTETAIGVTMHSVTASAAGGAATISGAILA